MADDQSDQGLPAYSRRPPPGHSRANPRNINLNPDEDLRPLRTNPSSYERSTAGQLFTARPEPGEGQGDGISISDPPRISDTGTLSGPVIAGVVAPVYRHNPRLPHPHPSFLNAPPCTPGYEELIIAAPPLVENVLLFKHLCPCEYEPVSVEGIRRVQEFSRLPYAWLHRWADRGAILESREGFVFRIRVLPMLGLSMVISLYLKPRNFRAAVDYYQAHEGRYHLRFPLWSSHMPNQNQHEDRSER